MRVDLEKFLIVGLEEQRAYFFEEAQKAGLIHFINPRPSGTQELPSSIQETLAAIKILRGLPLMEQEEVEEYELADNWVNEILQLNQELIKLTEEERLTHLEIIRVEAFGDFSHEDIAFIEREGKRTIQFFAAKTGTAEREDLPQELFVINSNHHGLDYFISISKESLQYDGLSEMQIPHTASQLKKRLVFLKKEIRNVEHRLKDYAKYNSFLHRVLLFRFNSYHLQAAASYSSEPLEGFLFAVTGWIPVDKRADLRLLAETTDVHIEQVAIEPGEIIPTYLENTGYEKIGEDLVDIYDTPSSTDKDPSWWVLTSFTVFFAMIVGDAGYGLIFLLMALFIRYKYANLKGLGHRIWKLALILSVACMAWGALTASYFGIHLDINSPIRKISLIHRLVEKKGEYHFYHKDDVYEEFVQEIPKLKESKTPTEFFDNATVIKKGKVEHPMYFRFYDNILFEMALMVGVIHIILSLLRYLDRNWSAIGWVIFMLGAYLYIPHYLNATSIIHFAFGVPKSVGEGGVYLVGGGILVAFILGLCQHRWKGFLEPMTVIQIFADAMSYLRIYALGLAGAMVSSTINEFASATFFAIGAVLFILGHATNIVLSIMGGVIHGLRLNFLEWYHYSFEGGGKKFNPLRLISKDKD
ncbi:V-type ATP synthase subunit I [Neochlamydia sp. TUME1]|uniref:ATP synthase subunit I n=1 Tax=Neochlamydia sp. TUME1 TaxID=1478174 RepID=UPI00058084B3|nr:ATP synthase subunit I [Neochlamydia sp. TUME1]KIC75116.1 V-type ATP synthase subunit I [Neochlamydia sp. TUME1]